MLKIKKIIGYILPHFIILLYQKFKEQKRAKLREIRLIAFRNNLPKEKTQISYDDIVKELVEKNIDRDQILSGSIPESYLNEIAGIIKESFGNQPIVGLHIGNFVGVSLVYLSGILINFNNRNHIVSIDPNIPHRGVDNPQSKVLYLINKYGLNNNISILNGYTLSKSISNDGNDYTKYDPIENNSNEYSCENQLEMLNRISNESFSYAIIDGNHEGDYLSSELFKIQKLICRKGLIIIDDVSEGWPEIKKLYESIHDSNLEKIFADDRIGVLRKK
jgi:hypothetical protein